MRSLYIAGIGLIAPGVDGWAPAQALLRGEAPYAGGEMPAHSPQRLPVNERRRATLLVRLAFRAAEEALGNDDGADLAAVFSSSEGDTTVLGRLCTALTQTPRVLSPTDFHNSVHNAPAGYWAIATGSRAPSTSISAHDGSFGAGLLEAACLAQEQPRVLLVAYDQVLPEPLHATRPLGAAFGVALLLAAGPLPGASARLTLDPGAEAETQMAEPAWESLRRGNPAARCLPLLQLLARRVAGTVTLPGGGMRLRVAVQPC